MKNNTFTFSLSLIFLFLLVSCNSTKDTTLSDDSTSETTFQIFQNGEFDDGELDAEPEAIAGEKEFFMTMYRKMNYPTQGRQQGIQGTVSVEVIINEMGILESSKISKSLRKDFDEEALAAVRRGFELPFKPAIQNGKPVKVKYEIPVRFKLNG